MLEPRSVKTWKEFVQYLQNSWDYAGHLAVCKEREGNSGFSIGDRELRHGIGMMIHLNKLLSVHHRGRTPTAIFCGHPRVPRDHREGYLLVDACVQVDPNSWTQFKSYLSRQILHLGDAAVTQQLLAMYPTTPCECPSVEAMDGVCSRQ